MTSKKPARRPSPKTSDYDDVVAWFKKRVPIQKDVWWTMDAKAQRKAFTVAGLAQLDLIADVQKALAKALRDGTTLADFKKAMGAKLKREWAGTVANPAARMENIFRTNVQMAYAQGRRQEMMEPAVMRARPFWRFLATLDKRTTHICEELNGTILPAQHSFWNSHQPPLHFQCRSTIQSLRRDDAMKRGVSEKIPHVPAMEGFGGTDPSTYQPDLTQYPPDLADVFRKKQKRAPKPKPPTDVPPPVVRDVPKPPPHLAPPKPAPKAKPSPLPPSKVHGVQGRAAHEADAFPKTAAAFGPKLHLRPSAKLSVHLAEMEALPEHIRAGLAGHVTEVFMGPGDVRATYPPLARDKTMAYTAGLYYPGARRVVVSEMPVSFSDSVMLHEFSHAWDARKALAGARFFSDRKVWQDAWREWADRPVNLGKFYYIRQKGGAGPSEAFAEFGATYLKHGAGAAGEAAVRAKFGDTPLIGLLAQAFKEQKP